MKTMHAALAATILLALSACSKDPAKTAPVSPTPMALPVPAQPGAANGAAGPGAAATQAAAAPAGNPEAAKDPVFNTPAQPVLDVAKAKADLDKIKADALK